MEEGVEVDQVVVGDQDVEAVSGQLKVLDQAQGSAVIVGLERRGKKEVDQL